MNVYAEQIGFNILINIFAIFTGNETIVIALLRPLFPWIEEVTVHHRQQHTHDISVQYPQNEHKANLESVKYQEIRQNMYKHQNTNILAPPGDAHAQFGRCFGGVVAPTRRHANAQIMPQKSHEDQCGGMDSQRTIKRVDDDTCEKSNKQQQPVRCTKWQHDDEQRIQQYLQHGYANVLEYQHLDQYKDDETQQMR